MNFQIGLIGVIGRNGLMLLPHQAHAHAHETELLLRPPLVLVQCVNQLEETETENGELDPDTGEVTITTQTTGTTATTTTETSSPVVPILIGVAALGALALFMRR